MTYREILAAIAVSDIETSIEWYIRLFGKPVDRRPMTEAAEWQLLPASGVQLVLAPDQAGQSMATIGVVGIDALVEELGQRGIEAKASAHGDGLFRLVRIADPDGNMITFAEPQSPAA